MSEFILEVNRREGLSVVPLPVYLTHRDHGTIDELLRGARRQAPFEPVAHGTTDTVDIGRGHPELEASALYIGRGRAIVFPRQDVKTQQTRTAQQLAQYVHGPGAIVVFQKLGEEYVCHTANATPPSDRHFARISIAGEWYSIAATHPHSRREYRLRIEGSGRRQGPMLKREPSF